MTAKVDARKFNASELAANGLATNQRLGSHFDMATAALLAPASLDIAKLQNVLGDMMSHKIDYADCLLYTSRCV